MIHFAADFPLQLKLLGCRATSLVPIQLHPQQFLDTNGVQKGHTWRGQNWRLPGLKMILGGVCSKLCFPQSCMNQKHWLGRVREECIWVIMWALAWKQMISAPKWGPGNTGPSNLKNWNWCFQGMVCSYLELGEKWWIKKVETHRYFVKHYLETRTLRKKERPVWKKQNQLVPKRGILLAFGWLLTVLWLRGNLQATLKNCPS